VLGALYQLTGKNSEAKAHYERAVSVHTALVRDYPKEETYQAALADGFINLGLILQSAAEYSSALKNYEKAEALLRPLVARQPLGGGGERALSLAALYGNWGQLLHSQGELEDALKKHTQAVDLAEAILEKEP